MIHTRTILRLVGTLLVLFSLAMLPSCAVALIYKDGGLHALWVSFLLTGSAGSLLWWLFRHEESPLQVADGFVVVVLVWTVLCAFAALPFFIAKQPEKLIDAVFEATSGLTTTGAEVMSGLDILPHGLRFYHQSLQFMGGLGIIVLAMAVMPMLGVGGMQLYRADTVGPVKDNTLRPRLAQTAKALWSIYLGLTVACIAGYKLAGMSWFDAIAESFSTVSTGGFSVHDQSFAFYHGIAIPLIATAIMLLSAMSYGLHFSCLQQRSTQNYIRNPELKGFAVMLGAALVVVCTVLALHQVCPQWGDGLVRAWFTTVSMFTTTGLRNADFATWPLFLPILFLLLATIGGCAGSTSGGLKMMRFLLLRREGLRTLHRLIHPKVVMSVNLEQHALPEDVVASIRGFVAIYFMLYVFLLMVFMATGPDFHTAFSAVTACLSNVGVTIGSLAKGYGTLSAASKSVLIFAMLAGRMEIMTLLVLFVPSFWRN